MKRRIIQIDKEKCNGCGLCVSACHEGAIGMQDGKAVLLRDDYCDGLGDCLPACPTNAITFEVRETVPYSHGAVIEASRKARGLETHHVASELTSWPVQIKLAPIQSPVYDKADILIAADCTAYAYRNFHEDFIRRHVTLIGCPKLDAVDYSDKLTEIFHHNDIRSVEIVRMEVPCCCGMEYAVRQAIEQSGKEITLIVTVIALDGTIKTA